MQSVPFSFDLFFPFLSPFTYPKCFFFVAQWQTFKVVLFHGMPVLSVDGKGRKFIIVTSDAVKKISWVSCCRKRRMWMRKKKYFCHLCRLRNTKILLILNQKSLRAEPRGKRSTKDDGDDDDETHNSIKWTFSSSLIKFPGQNIYPLIHVYRLSSKSLHSLWTEILPFSRWKLRVNPNNDRSIHMIHIQ